MNKKKIIKIGIPVAAGCIVLALGIGFAVKNSGMAGTMIAGLQVTEPSQRTKSRTFTWMILCRSHRFT